MKKQFGLIAVLILIGLYVRCGKSNTVVGSWKSAQPEESIWFREDGTWAGVLLAPTSPRTIDGTYFVTEDKLSLTPNGASPMAGTIRFDDDGNLIITWVQGGSLKYDNSMSKYARVR